MRHCLRVAGLLPPGRSKVMGLPVHEIAQERPQIKYGYLGGVC
ncbi:hypothetical protein [Ottowia thiooxydans]|uniref:Uncharacterized protein n=1 Tax=Ottowia thiooxydans TaxID=219182 RepID=A0ABV2QAB8_9BURK